MASAAPWECPSCTFANRLELQVCEMCGTENPAGAFGEWSQYEMGRTEWDALTSIFYRFLPDGSDSLNLAAFGKLAKTLNFAQDEAAVQRLFLEIDRDRQGVSLDEFRRFVGTHPPQTGNYHLTLMEYNTALMQFAEYADANTGFVTQARCADLMLNLRFAPDRATALEMARRIDRDGDSRITAHELLLFRAQIMQTNANQPNASQNAFQ